MADNNAVGSSEHLYYNGTYIYTPITEFSKALCYIFYLNFVHRHLEIRDAKILHTPKHQLYIPGFRDRA